MNEDRYEEVQLLANRLNELIYYEMDIRHEKSEFQSAYEHLKNCINYKAAEARSLVEDLKNRSLTINTIEAEGFLRCAQELVEDLQDAEDLIKESI